MDSNNIRGCKSIFFSLYMLPRNFRELTSACTPFPTFLGYFLSYAFSVGSNLFNQVIFLKQPLTNIFSICKINDRLFQKILNLSNEPNSWRTYWCVFIWNFELTLKCILLPNRKNDIVFFEIDLPRVTLFVVC